ncbi:hypothetical protein K7X08_026555 [Anisodus acutangulus]|uniref:Major facilitator superfamily (MFS) profile domain-containing protein n=1 Tax=Anisodus acutangulus TaxID=402998 RepID=A0A9Q1LQM7_9SOLA|nr:hypothetical protein K7X08_026555 [Anisodus acutangulus]
MEKADETLLPGVYKKVGEDLHTDPTGLSSRTLFRSLVQCLCYPLAAYLSARYNRAHVIALGAFLWPAATFLVAVSSTFAEIAISRGLNGIGLAIVTPAIQSLVADSTNASNRGTAFGWLQLTSNFGSTLGGLISVLLAETSLMGIPGWRISFHLVGIISVAVGILVRLFARDPRFLVSDGNAKDQPPPQPFQEEVRQLLKEAKAVMRVPSFQLLIVLIGFSHKATAFLWTSLNVAQSLGALFGGTMADVLAKHLPNSGRIILAQISSGSAVTLAAILLLLLPYDPSTVVVHGLVLFIMRLFISWNAPACNKDCARLQHTEETGNSPSEERQALLENDEQRLLSVS